MQDNTQLQELDLEEVKAKSSDINHLVLYNDDHNTFEFVIDSLIKVCGHDTVQAEQCTYLVHYSGKCSVKTGSRQKLKPFAQALLDRGLSAEIN
jgi:ATP-dependent Clp protease adaptor protein ClpS